MKIRTCNLAPPHPLKTQCERTVPCGKWHFNSSIWVITVNRVISDHHVRNDVGLCRVKYIVNADLYSKVTLKCPNIPNATLTGQMKMNSGHDKADAEVYCSCCYSSCRGCCCCWHLVMPQLSLMTWVSHLLLWHCRGVTRDMTLLAGWYPETDSKNSLSHLHPVCYTEYGVPAAWTQLCNLQLQKNTTRNTALTWWKEEPCTPLEAASTSFGLGHKSAPMLVVTVRKM